MAVVVLFYLKFALSKKKSDSISLVAFLSHSHSLSELANEETIFCLGGAPQSVIGQYNILQLC